MANYKLSLTGEEIDERLAQIPEIGEEVSNLKEELNDLSSQIGQGGGFPEAAGNLLITILKNCAWYSDQTTNINTLEKLISGGGTGGGTTVESTITAEISGKVLRIGNVASVSSVAQDDATLKLTIKPEEVAV